MNQLVEVGIIGEFDPNLRYHCATNEALGHAANALSITLKATWISTQSLRAETAETTMGKFDGIWCAPGDYQHIDGALLGIQMAREQGLPFMGT